MRTKRGISTVPARLMRPLAVCTRVRVHGRTVVAATVLSVIAYAGTAGVATARPAEQIQVAISADDHVVRLHTDSGELRVAQNQLQILDPNGIIVGGVPLLITYLDAAYPIAAAVEGHTATLTPRTDLVHPVAAPAPIADDFDTRLNTAMANANNELGTAVAVGTLLGAIIGFPVGCLLGAAFGGVAGVATTFGALTIPMALGGCLATGIAGAALGVVVCNLVIGVPALIASAIHFYNTVNAPDRLSTSSASSPSR
ncbi:hypothetical protein ACWIGW_16525 [Nocardia brasiliensis]